MNLLGAIKRSLVPLSGVVGISLSLAVSVLIIPFVGNWLHVFAYGVPFGHAVPIDQATIWRSLLGLVGLFILWIALFLGNVVCYHASQQITKKVICR